MLAGATIPFPRDACSTESSLILAGLAATTATTAGIRACPRGGWAAARRSLETDDCSQEAEIWGCRLDLMRRRERWAVLR